MDIKIFIVALLAICQVNTAPLIRPRPQSAYQQLLQGRVNSGRASLTGLTGSLRLFCFGNPLLFNGFGGVTSDFQSFGNQIQNIVNGQVANPEAALAGATQTAQAGLNKLLALLNRLPMSRARVELYMRNARLYVNSLISVAQNSIAASNGLGTSGGLSGVNGLGTSGVNGLGTSGGLSGVNGLGTSGGLSGVNDLGTSGGFTDLNDFGTSGSLNGLGGSNGFGTSDGLNGLAGSTNLDNPVGLNDLSGLTSSGSVPSTQSLPQTLAEI